MTRCKTCFYTTLKPDLHFQDGRCSACRNFEARPRIDWSQRKRDLGTILERGRNGSGYDCIVPSSGGKDSHAQVLTMIEMGARPLVVTATTCHLTPIGRRNIDNLARFATTMEVTPNRDVRATLNRLGLTLVGDCSYPEHLAIYSIPFRVATKFGIPLIFYGECSQQEYGGPPGTEEARQMTRRWVSEFGGMNGLRPSDLAGMEGLTAEDMADYQMPADLGNVEAHFLGQYMPWDSWANAELAKENGMEWEMPSSSAWWPFENLDNSQTGLHDHLCYRKFGYGRLAAQIGIDIRNGRIAREEAAPIVDECDGLFPEVYAGVSVEEVLSNICMSRDEFKQTIDRFTNWSLFDGEENLRPILKPEFRAQAQNNPAAAA